jgi:hypothetical protein
LALAVAAGSTLLVNAQKKTGFTIRDRAYYADPNTVNFVRPGLTIQIVSAKIATDGVISGLQADRSEGLGPRGPRD